MVVACLAGVGVTSSDTAVAAGPTITGAGSTWVQIALDQWRADIARQGYSINYQGVGSSAGRTLYVINEVDFAASEIPFQPDEVAQLASVHRHYQYMPDVAGGTSLMYNLHTPAGSRITSLRLNADTAGKIFTGVITRWNDPEIAALNPGLQMRETRIEPVIRSDGSGTSAQFSLYLADQAPDVWNSFVSRQGCRAPCSQWPVFAGSINAAYSDGVANFVANDALGSGAIGYVEAGYAFGRGFPVASLHNVSGNYTQPTAGNVATALTHATLYPDLTQNLIAVYRAPEANAYPMSSYSYMILPCVAPPSASPTCSTDAAPNFGPDKGFVLGTWIIYIACAGQRKAAPLGYSPLPPNLIQADMNAVNRLPGHPTTPPLDYQHCPNPNLAAGGNAAGPTLQGSGGAPSGTVTAPAGTTSSGAAGSGTGASGTTTSGTAASGGAPAGEAGQTVGSATGGDTSVDLSNLSPTTALPPGVVKVTVQDATSRARLLQDALAAAAHAQAPSRTPLWIAVLIILLVVFTPMLAVTARRTIPAAVSLGGSATATISRAGARAAPVPKPFVAWIVAGAVVTATILGYFVASTAYSQAQMSAAQTAYKGALDDQEQLAPVVLGSGLKLNTANVTTGTRADLQREQASIAQLVGKAQAAQPLIEGDDNSLAAAEFGLEDKPWLTVMSRSSFNTESTRIARLRKALADAETLTSDYVQIGAFYDSFYDVAIDIANLDSKIQARDATGAAAVNAQLQTDTDKAIALDKAPGLPSEVDSFLQTIVALSTDVTTSLSAIASPDPSTAQPAVSALKADTDKLSAFDSNKIVGEINAFYKPLTDDYNAEMARSRLGRG